MVGGRYGCDWLEEEVVGGRYVCDWLEEEVVGGRYVCVMDFNGFLLYFISNSTSVVSSNR